MCRSTDSLGSILHAKYSVSSPEQERIEYREALVAPLKNGVTWCNVVWLLGGFILLVTGLCRLK